MKLAYIPQGRCGRLINKVLGLPQKSFDGLCTDGFSTCNIIVLYNSSKIILTHADIQFDLNDIEDDIKWMGSDCKKVLIRRRQWREASQQAFGSVIKQHAFEVHEVENSVNTVMLSFNNKGHSDLGDYIRLYPTNTQLPDTYYHPQDPAMTDYLKINRIFSVQQQLKQPTTSLIFDGLNWLAVPEVDISYAPTFEKHVGAHIKAAESHNLVASKALGTHMQLHTENPEIKLWGGESKELAFAAAFHLESILNDYKLDDIFIRNIKDVLNARLKEIKTSSDKDLYRKLLVAAKDSSTAVAGIQAIVHAVGPDKTSEFATNVLSETNTYLRHHQQRDIYQQARAKKNPAEKKAVRLNRRAALHFRQREYSAAANLFIDVLELYMLYQCNPSEELAVIYHNLGGCYQELGRSSAAELMLSRSLQIKEQIYSADSSSVAKTKARIDRLNSENHNSPHETSSSSQSK